MKNVKLSFLFILGAFCLSMSSCGSDIDCEDPSAFNESTTALNAASNALIQNPTDEDACNTFVDAVREFIDMVDEYEECFSDEEFEQLQTQTRDLETQLDGLDCN